MAPPELMLSPRRPRRRANAWAIGLSVALHLALFAIPWTEWDFPPREVPDVALLPPVHIQAIELPPLPDQQRPRPRPRTEPVETPVSEEEPLAPVAEIAAAEPGAMPVAEVDSAAGPPAPEGQGRQTVPRLVPSIGEGKLWVQPLPLAPKELAQRLTRSHYELVDSAVTAVVQAYLDSVLASPAGRDALPPEWITRIGGKTFGIDSRNIHIGGLKIPTAVLALLPIPQVSNVNLEYTRRMSQMRADLQYAAQRAQTMEEFKEAVRVLRERRAREREFERNQRRQPVDTVPP